MSSSLLPRVALAADPQIESSLPDHQPARSRGSRVVFLLTASIFLSFGGDIARAADGAWFEIPPPTRSDHTAILDPGRDRMLVFGGSEGDVLRAEVFALSLSTAAWEEIHIEGPGPSARVGHSALYDPVRDRMLVFGGWDGTTFLNDIWALSLSGSPQWTSIAAEGAPPSGRYEHTAVYDPVGDRMLVFGGFSPWARRNDTWALSLAGTPAWTQLSPAGALPPPRSGHSAILDPIRRRMLVFAGDGGTYLDDLWALSLDGDPSWAPIVPPGPRPSRTYEHIAVYDAAHDRMIVDGGSNGLYGARDCWVLPLAAGASWELFPLHDRWQHSAIYDPERDAVVVYGGLELGGYDNATWRLVLAPPPDWELFSDAGWAPRQLAGATIYDPIARRMIVFGGQASGCMDPCPSGGTVSYSLAGDYRWTWLTQGPERYDHTAIYDPVRRRMVAFGGDTFYGPMLNDTWELPLAGAPQWNQVVPSGSPPAARRAHTAVYDPVADRMLVFGGTDGRWVGGGTLFNDVWELAFAGGVRWTLLTPLGPPPSPRESHTAIYDPDGERMIVFGGRDASGLLSDLWALSLSGALEWIPIAAEGLPPSPRAAHTALHDPLRQRMVVYGGTRDGDVWALDLTPPGPAAWSPFDAAGVPPSGREDHTAVYDATADRMVVCGSWSQGGMWGWLGSSAVTVLTFGETAAVPTEAPGLAVLLFLGARPNPASGEFEVFFESASRAPAVLELVDVTGRRLARRDLGTPAAGSHQVRFEGVRLPAGTYFLRLTQGGRSMTSKISIVP